MSHRKTPGKLLIVDDNPEALIALELYLEKHFTQVQTEKNPILIPHHLAHTAYDVIILDMNFSAGISSGNEGLYWLNEILKIDPLAAVVFITAYGDIELAVKGIKRGAHDFISKPWENEKLLATVTSAFRYRRSRLEVNSLKNKQRHLSSSIAQHYQAFRGNSPAMLGVYQVLSKVASTDANVLIRGENGTGKEWIARELHARSGKELFVSLDVAALPPGLVESELFGYKKGAFTGANEDRAGRLELAAGGTLFLDEVGNIPPAVQAKLLTVLQNREITRLGDTHPIPVSFRLISATNAGLEDMAANGTFREDLLYRINTIQLDIPPLRERPEDLEGLVAHFLTLYSKKYKKQQLRIHPSVFKKLKDYRWPGNIRELNHVTEKAVILAEGQVLRPVDFQLSQDPLPRGRKKIFSLAENEKLIIREAMKDCNGNLSETADRLGITRATLYRKIKKYAL